MSPPLLSSGLGSSPSLYRKNLALEGTNSQLSAIWPGGGTWALVSQLPTHSRIHPGKAIAVSLGNQAGLSLVILPTSTNYKSNIQMTVRHVIWSGFPLITEARTDDFFNPLPGIDTQFAV